MKLLLILSSLLISLGAIAETRYVSDSLTIFIRTGPTHQFRIVGTLVAGEPVEIIEEDAENKASHIRLSTGREVWVDTEQLMTDKPTSLLLMEVADELQQFKISSNQELSSLKQELVQAKEMSAISEELQQQVTQLEYDKDILEQKNQTLSDRSRYDLLTAGGVVALAGLLLGLLLPRLVRRRRNDVWR